MIMLMLESQTKYSFVNHNNKNLRVPTKYKQKAHLQLSVFLRSSFEKLHICFPFAKGAKYKNHATLFNLGSEQQRIWGWSCSYLIFAGDIKTDMGNCNPIQANSFPTFHKSEAIFQSTVNMENKTSFFPS